MMAQPRRKKILFEPDPGSEINARAPGRKDGKPTQCDIEANFSKLAVTNDQAKWAG
jgi:hypothetical protein